MSEELSDEQVFGAPKEMSDEDVFGKPPAEPEPVPPAFLDRVRAGQALSRVFNSAAKEATDAYGSPSVTGFEDETVAHLTDMGIFHDPAKGRPGPIQLANEAMIMPAAKALDVIMRGVNAGIHGAGGALGQIVEEFGGSQGTANRAKNEVINAANWAMIEGGMDRFSRPSITRQGVADQTVGGLPRPEDFENAAKVLSQPETIRSPAVRVGGKDVYEDLNHGLASEKAEKAIGRDLTLDEMESGFTTSGGRFVERDEAAKIAGSAEDLQSSDLRRKTTEQNLKQMWQQDGIHPAEAVHDAQSDAFLKNEITARRNEVRLAPESQVPEGSFELPLERILKEGDGAQSPFILSDGRVVSTGGDHISVYAPAEQRDAGALRVNFGPARDDTFSVYIEAREGQTVSPEQMKIVERLLDKPNAKFGFVVRAGDEIGSEPIAKGSTLKEFREAVETHATPVEKAAMTAEDFEALTETGGRPGSLSAAITPPDEIPLDVQPASPPGSLAASFKAAGDKLMDMGRDAQMLMAPMARGTTDSMAIAKDFANSMRRNRWDWSRIDKDIADKFTPEQRTRMWNAADEESLSLRLEEPASMREHQGLNTLEPAERAMVEELQTRSQNAWVRARDLGMVEGEGLPAYTPRMIINVASAGSRDTALALDGIGGNLRTKTGNLLKRKYMEAEDTQAAAQAKYGDQAMLARDIRVLPLATSQLEDAIAGRTLINSIKEYGERTGAEMVSEGAIPTGTESKWFTLDHPAFKTWRPKMGETADGSFGALKDEAGNSIYEQVPLYVHGDFEGPLRAVLSSKSGAMYGGMMALKGKTMSLIMNSPMIHNAVEWGRAFPAAPFKVGTFKVYFEGNRAKNNVPLMHEAIDNGLVPIGHRFFNQDITSVMESPDLTPGRSLTSKVAAFIPGLFDEAAGTAVKSAIDKAGDFWHNTLLWDRVADLQMGLYKNFLDAGIDKGLDRQTSAKVAAHLANRYAGSLPKEAMSDGATKLANLMLFSRSFTLGNLGVMKDMFTGLPKDVMAQIERDAGFRAGSINEAGELNSPVEDAAALAKSMARRKAISTVALDVGLLYVGNSVMQSALNVMLGGNTLDQEAHGYVRRFKDYLDKGSQNPLSMLWPSNITSLSSTSENEPGLENRLKIGHTKDGTAIYARNPVGKIGEEFVGWGTSPIDILKRKEGTIARPLLQILSNDAGFGRKIYDPEANTPAAMAGTVWAIAKHLAGSQLPEGQITALSDLVKGEGDKTVNELQLAGPLAGVTFRKGAPGGEAVGEMYHNKSAFEFRVQQAMPDIRKQILRGDVAGAQQAMTGLGMDGAYSRYVVKTTQNPATRLGSKALRDFYRTATPEQRDRMTRIHGGSQPYAGPNLGPLAQP